MIFVWNIAAIGDPASRWILEDLNAFLARMIRILVGRYCQPVRSWVIANGIVNGKCRVRTDNWWESGWTAPRRVTIDRGRDGKLYTLLLDRGMLTLDEWWSMLGKDSRRMRRDRIDEIADDLAYCQARKVPYEFYMAPTQGSNIGVPSPEGDAVSRFTPDQEAAIQTIVTGLISQNSAGAAHSRELAMETYNWELPSQEHLWSPYIPGSVGNCWQCCVAAVLQRPVYEVPHFLKIAIEREGDMDAITQEWLNEQQGCL